MLRFSTIGRRKLLVLVVVASAVLAAALGSAATARGSAKENTKVSVRMDFFAAGYHSWAAVAIAKGWYAKEGLDVEFQEGQGSSSTSQLVASGKTTFGFVSPIAAIQTIAGGGKLKYVFGLHQRDGSGLLAPRGKGLAGNPKWLEGKTCIQSAFGYIKQLLPAFWAKTGVDGSKVKLVTLPSDAMVPALNAGQADAYCEALSWGEPISFKTKYNLDVDFIPFAKYGIAPEGHGIIVNSDFLQQNPEAVRAFLRASLKGMRYEADNPAQAVQILHDQVKAFNTLEGDTKILKATKFLWVVPNTKGKPLGWMNKQNIITTVKLMRDYMKLTTVPGLDQIFTNDYVPGWKGNPLPKK